MRKVFIDLGGNRGQGVRQFVEMYNIDSSWDVETYEPNDFCNLEEELSDLPFVQVNKKAVWVHDGTVAFYRTISHKDGRAADVKNDGICYIDEGSSVLGLNSGDVRSCVQEIINMECVDISGIINKYDQDDYIVVKMDVEGSEFELVRKLLKDGMVSKINEFYIEWHTNCMDSETPQSEYQLKKELRECGVSIHDWH
jgi:FkbM family methyltransferase